MAGAYVYTQGILLPLAAAVFVAAIGLYTWRRRDVPARKPFVAASLFGSLLLLGIALETAAVAPATKVAWYQWQSAVQMLAVTAGTCFTLEYTYPGHWLTRRNLTLLAVPPLLTMLLIVVDAQLIWEQLAVGPDGPVVVTYTAVGALLVAYSWCLVFLNAAAFLWLYAHSPQHRVPVMLMLCGQVAGRALILLDVARLPAPTGLDPAVLAVLAPWATYAIALFGFHILDPLPAARETALAQMREGMIVLDSAKRVASLNPAAAKLLNTVVTRAGGKLLGELLPAFADLPARLTAVPAEQRGEPVEIKLATGTEEHWYAVVDSELKDFHGQPIGHLLMLRDVTEQKRARAQILEQERALATLQEREWLARELHDGVAQTLAAAQLQVKTAKLLHTRGLSVQLDACLDGLADTTLQAEADVREYLLGVKTTMSGDRPFFLALREYLARFTATYGLPVDLTVPPELEEQGLPSTVELQLLRIIQEALANVRKHAYPTPVNTDRRAGTGEREDYPPCRVQVVFSLAGAQARLAIVDNGRGFDPVAVATQSNGYGLRSMGQRAEAVGGSLAVVSNGGEGTQLIVLVPWNGMHGDAKTGPRDWRGMIG